MSQYDSDQWDSGLCAGTGDEPSAVQSSLCYLRLDVCTHKHWPAHKLMNGLSEERFSYLICSINRNAVVVIIAGFLIDKLGNRCKFIYILYAIPCKQTTAKRTKWWSWIEFCVLLRAVGVFLFSFLCVLGSSLFALGSHFTGTPYLLPLMLTGRLLFGSGNGSLTSMSASHQSNLFCSDTSEECS